MLFLCFQSQGESPGLHQIVSGQALQFSYNLLHFLLLLFCAHCFTSIYRYILGKVRSLITCTQLSHSHLHSSDVGHLEQSHCSGGVDSHKESCRSVNSCSLRLYSSIVIMSSHLPLLSVIPDLIGFAAACKMESPGAGLITLKGGGHHRNSHQFYDAILNLGSR